MRRRTPNHRLAALLDETGWTAARLARTVNSLGAAQQLTLRYDRTAVAHWLDGSRPRPPVAELVAAAFTQHLRRVVTAADTGLTGPPDAPAPSRAARSTGGSAVHDLVTLCRGEADPARRGHLARLSYTVTDLHTPPSWPSAPPPEDGPPGDTPVAVHRLQEMSRITALLHRRYGGGHARTAVTGYLADDVSRLLRADAQGRPDAQICRAAAQLVHLLAVMTDDAGLPGLAQRYFDLALALAHQAGDRRLYAITLRTMSGQALRLHHTYQARRFADAALEVARRGGGPAVRSYLLTQYALAHARERHRHQALAALAAAERQHDRATSSHDPFLGYPPAGLHYQRAEVLLALDQAPQARAALRASLRERPQDQHRPVALTHARLAEVLHQAGHLEAACGHWNAFLDAYPPLFSHHADRALAQLTQHLRPYRRHRAASVVLHRAHGVRGR